MSELPEKLQVPVWSDTGRVLSFERTEDVIKWAETEKNNWALNSQPQNRQLKQAWDRQCEAFAQLITFSNQIESMLQTPEQSRNAQQLTSASNNLKNTFSQITNGKVLTSEHRNYRFIAQLALNDGDAAIVLMLSSRSDAQQTIPSIQPPPFDAISRIAAGLIDSGKLDQDVAAHRRELASLKNDGEKELSAVRETLQREVAQSKEIDTDHATRVREHQSEWGTLLEKCENEWAELKKVYDEQLSLQAPTDYWKTRARQYGWQSLFYAIAFGVVLVAALWLFVWLGINELKLTKPSASILIAILPVIVPAFAGVWVLRILGRQLSESLAIMKDAQERVTLVKTFLALMRDETTGKAVVRDEDRALILQALFRQSRVTSVDDSPPINSIEAILKPFNR